jgi:hypothetical protein
MKPGHTTDPDAAPAGAYMLNKTGFAALAD